MPRSIRASAMSSRRHLTFALGVAISLALAATAALSLVYTPRDPLAMAGAARLEGPSRTHPFGTDQYGRDVLSRVMAGAATSLAGGVIGLGTQPPHPSWGLMLKEAQNFLGMNPWFALFPGGAIAVAVLGLNLLGDGLRDLLDPKAA